MPPIAVQGPHIAYGCNLHVKPRTVKKLAHGSADVLRSAVQSVDKAYRLPGGFEIFIEYDFARLVYGCRGKPCAVCGSEIQRILQGGRSTYFCSRCQR